MNNTQSDILCQRIQNFIQKYKDLLARTKEPAQIILDKPAGTRYSLLEDIILFLNYYQNYRHGIIQRSNSSQKARKIIVIKNMRIQHIQKIQKKAEQVGFNTLNSYQIEYNKNKITSFSQNLKELRANHRIDFNWDCFGDLKPKKMQQQQLNKIIANEQIFQQTGIQQDPIVMQQQQLQNQLQQKINKKGSVQKQKCNFLSSYKKVITIEQSLYQQKQIISQQNEIIQSQKMYDNTQYFEQQINLNMQQLPSIQVNFFSNKISFKIKKNTTAMDTENNN